MQEIFDAEERLRKQMMASMPQSVDPSVLQAQQAEGYDANTECLRQQMLMTRRDEVVQPNVPEVQKISLQHTFQSKEEMNRHLDYIKELDVLLFERERLVMNGMNDQLPTIDAKISALNKQYRESQNAAR